MMPSDNLMDRIRECAAIEAGYIGPEEAHVLRLHRSAIARILAERRAAGTLPELDAAILRCKVET